MKTTALEAKTTTELQTTTSEAGVAEALAAIIGSDPVLAEAAAKQAARNIETFSTYKLLPEIKISHGAETPKFVLPDKKEVDYIEGHIVVNESTRSYFETEGQAPVCTSIGCKNGTCYGECRNCEYGTFNEEAGSSKCRVFRKLVMVLPEHGVVGELTIPGTSVTEFDNFKNTCMVEMGTKILLPVKIKMTLTGEKKKTRKWAAVHFQITGTLDTKDAKTVELIQKSFKKYKDIYVTTPVMSGGSKTVETTYTKAPAEKAPTPEKSSTFDTGESTSVPF